MGAGVEDSTRQLFVTGPARDDLFEHFSRLFYGRADVTVIKDRRYAERRSERSPVSRERRAGDRRRRWPEWMVPPGPVEL